VTRVEDSSIACIIAACNSHDYLHLELLKLQVRRNLPESKGWKKTKNKQNENEGRIWEEKTA